MLERRSAVARQRREAARRERAAIEREKAAARRERAAREREKAAARRTEAAPARPRATSTPPEPERGRRPAGRHGRTWVRAGGAAAGRGGTAARPPAQRAAAGIAAFGERASGVLRAAAAPLTGGLVAAAELARGGVARLAVVVTPLRAVVAVTAIAAVLLGVSQFVDYRGVAVGAEDYSAYTDVENVAPAPQVDHKPAGEAHSYLLVPVAVAALVLLVASIRGRWQLGRAISLLGLVALAVSLLVDVPAGLDEGKQEIAYAGAEARLLEGFYVQVVSAAVLVAGGLLVSLYARPARRQRPRTRGREATVRPLGARPA
jgi:hypothetical protein